MKIPFDFLSSCAALLLLAAVLSTAGAQPAAVERLRELRDKARAGTLTAAEKTELDQAMAARAARRGSGAPSPASAAPTPSASDRLLQAQQKQLADLERMRESGAKALRAAEARVVEAGPPRQFYVNNETGDDKASGLAPAKTAQDGPVRTLAKAVKLLRRPGDTLHLAVTNKPYRESLNLDNGFGGAPGKPVVIDGHGATLLGTDPLRPEGWEATATPGLYKSAKLLSQLELTTEEAAVDRMFFVFGGAVQFMGRTMKGAKAPFKAPADLKPGEWTYIAAEKSFYLRVAGKLEGAKVEVPYRCNGVGFRGNRVAVTHVVIKNLVACRVLNDGFNIHGTTKDVLLQNIAAYECGDDGLSPHETCEQDIDGFWSVGNSTGMCPINLAVTRARNIHLEGNLGQQFMAMNSAVTELTNAVLIAAPRSSAINLGNAQGLRLRMQNVQVSAPARQQITIGPDATLEAAGLTVLGAAWDNRGRTQLSQCVLGLSRLVSAKGAAWAGEKNVYASGVTPPPGEAAPMVRPLDAGRLKLTSEPMPGAGANPGKFEIPPRPAPHPSIGVRNLDNL